MSASLVSASPCLRGILSCFGFPLFWIVGHLVFVNCFQRCRDHLSQCSCTVVGRLTSKLLLQSSACLACFLSISFFGQTQVCYLPHTQIVVLETMQSAPSTMTVISHIEDSPCSSAPLLLLPAVMFPAPSICFIVCSILRVPLLFLSYSTRPGWLAPIPFLSCVYLCCHTHQTTELVNLGQILKTSCLSTTLWTLQSLNSLLLYGKIFSSIIFKFQYHRPRRTGNEEIGAWPSLPEKGTEMQGVGRTLFGFTHLNVYLVHFLASLEIGKLSQIKFF